MGRFRTEPENAFTLRIQDSNFAVDFEGFSRVMILLFDEDQTVYILFACEYGSKRSSEPDLQIKEGFRT